MATSRFSTGALKSLIDAGVGPIFDTTGVIKIYTGSLPATADAAPTGTLLGTLTLSSDAFAAATGSSPSNCQTAANSITDDTTADNSGTAGYFRMQLTGDGGGISTSDKRLDGDITATGGGAAMTFDVIIVVAGGVIHASSFVIAHPA